ncbi:hypothetical protein GCM10017779_09500 [Streptomyces capillispiralis]|nr:hypothetical protein GCM10017779_09500 [Streptomyces capillispiralis]
MWLCTDIEVRAPVRWTVGDARARWGQRGVSDERPHYRQMKRGGAERLGGGGDRTERPVAGGWSTRDGP